jgi:sulfotransferase family protein
MIVLCVGMPRAGSGWHYNLVHDLMQTTGCAEARDIRTRFHLESVLTEVNCNIGVLSARRLAMVSVPALLGNTFVIKAHAGPSAAWRLLRRAGLLRTLYIYRDPRDAMLSAYNYGQRALLKGRPNAFSHLTDFSKSLDFITDYVRIWEAWMREKNVLISRYEDLLTDYEGETRRVAMCLGLDEREPEIREVIENYRPGRAEGQQGTHFFKGKIGRFRESYSQAEQELLSARLGPFLSRMGYAV